MNQQVDDSLVTPPARADDTVKGELFPPRQAGRTESYYKENDLIIVAASHRKIANALPSGMMAFGSTLLLMSLYKLHVANIQVSQGVMTFALAFGGLSQFLSGLWEFASGNTFGGTFFVAYAAYWWGYSIIFIPFFGMSGTYDGSAGIYSAEGLAAGEAHNAIGLFYWIWFGISLCFLLSSARSSGVMVFFLVLLTIMFAMLAAEQYNNSSACEMAAGAFGVAAAFVGYYIASAALFTKNTSFFSLPVLSLAKQP